MTKGIHKSSRNKWIKTWNKKVNCYEISDKSSTIEINKMQTDSSQTKWLFYYTMLTEMHISTILFTSATWSVLVYSWYRIFGTYLGKVTFIKRH